MNDNHSSVGEAVASRPVFSADHPEYKILADAVAERLQSVAAERAAARAKARSLPSTIALDTADTTLLVEQYPEFTMVPYGTHRPGHPLWVQSRRLANEWLALQAETYASHVVHVGGALGTYLVNSTLTAQIIMDTTNPVAVHEAHAQGVDVYRFFGDFATVGEDLGRVLDREKYGRYLERKGVLMTPASVPLQRADAVLVDLSVGMVAPVQMAAMMLEAHADVGFGFFPYCPEMLVEDTGHMGDTGVVFRRARCGIHLQYPHGVAGETYLDYALWEPWLVNHTFSVGERSKKYFQVELLNNRGHLMFFRMVALPCAPATTTITHALDVPMEERSYVVAVPELRSPGADPRAERSWRVKPFFASQRVVDRAYNDAMTLPREQFTTYNVRKKICDANDRVVINGSRVLVNSRLGVEYVNKLALAVSSRAFVDRYDAGQLVTEVMKSMRAFMEPTVSFSRVARAVFGAVMWYAAAPVRWLDSSFTAMAEWVDGIFGAKHLLPARFDKPLGYVLVGDVASLPRDLSRFGPQSLVASSRAVVGKPGFAMANVVHACAAAAGKTLGLGWSALTYRWEYEDVTKSKRVDALADQFVSAVVVANEVRADVRTSEHVVVAGEHADQDLTNHDRVADAVGVFNRFYELVNPGVGAEDLDPDSGSLSLDPQDRHVVARRLVLPLDMTNPPNPIEVYKSNVRALGVAKRQSTVQELFSSLVARNLNAPQVSLPQDEDAMAKEVWSNFKAVACVPDVEERLRAFKDEPVSLAEGPLREWAASVDEAKLKRVVKQLDLEADSLESMDVGEYLMMLKSDVKPDLTTKPVAQRIEPQVIVHHRTELNALYSSIFRVLVDRFLSILRPNFRVILRKDLSEVERVIQNVHPFGGVFKYLENDFSKYDKSQGRFAFQLETYIFGELGMDAGFLAQWLGGHITSRARSIALGMSISLDYQRKSGDATTALGNVLLNIVSVCYAYKGTDIVWAVFMGDDSLVCCLSVAANSQAVKILAEIFNLGAKTFVTEHPYFASNFLVVDDVRRVVRFVPDPVKRVARWSMSVSASDPQWSERFTSARDSCKAYLDEANLAAVPGLVAGRYPVAATEVTPVLQAVSTVVSDETEYRAMWADTTTFISFG